MKKIEIWDGSKEGDVLRLKLVADGIVIRLVATDRDGEPLVRGYILEITQDGKLHLNEGLSYNLGLCVNEEGCIQCV